MQPGSPNNSAADSRLVQSASWLYWVAALSAVNIIIQMSGGSWGFSMGLGVTEILTGASSTFGPMATTIAMTASIVVIVILVFLGYMACRGVIWAFVVGIAILCLDTLILIPFIKTEWLSVAFHVWAVVSLVTGLIAARKIQSGTYTA